MEKTKFGFVLIALIMIAVGVIFVIQPGNAVDTIFTIFAVALIVAGAIGLLNYFQGRGQVGPYTVLSAIVEIIVGLLILLHRGAAVAFYATVIGIVVIIDAVENIMDAFAMKKLGLSAWSLVFIMSLISLCAGILIVFNPFGAAEALVTIAGIILIYQGVVNLVLVFKRR